MYASWDMLVGAENIEIGDTIVVDGEEGQVHMKFRGVSRGVVFLLDENKKIVKFDADSLEEIDGERYIVEKFD